MKAAFLSLAVVAGLALSAGTASAQYRSFGGHGGHGHGHGGHGHGHGYTEYHSGYWHGNHYHPGHLHTYSRPPVVYSNPVVVTPYNAGLYGPNPYSGVVRPSFNSGYGYNSGYGNRYSPGYGGYSGRRW